MAVLAVILKVLGALVTFISGLTALNYPTRDRDGLTTFGWIFLSALVIGIACSGGGVVLDWLVKKADDAKNEQQMHQLKVAADAARFTTADAVSITVSVDKSLPALKAVIATLDQALEYAKSHCRSPGDVAQCKDFIIRTVIIDELRFDKKSSLFPLASKDKQAAAIMNGLGVLVRFYNEKFVPSLNLGKNSSGGFFLTEKTISGTTLFEYDAFRLRWFIGGKLPPEAFNTKTRRP